MKKRFFLALMVLASSMCAFQGYAEASPVGTKADNTETSSHKLGRVTGTVTDVNGEPIIGAVVSVKGAKISVLTDINGNFVMDGVPEGAKLVVNYVGFEKTEANATPSPVSITLNEKDNLLDEVVVVGYGVQKKADLTGAVSNISADKLNTQSNATIGQALQGKIAGVDVVSLGGNPGDGVKIMVRGIGTLNNSTPLYIVDGMYMTEINHLNPADIESIDVLKDASSAAIYGSRAANGVVIITTKSGSNTEGKPNVNLSVNLGVNTPSKKLKMLNAQEWAQVTTAARQAVGLSPLDMAVDLGSKEDNDWQDIMFRNALMQNYNMSISGGGKYSTYYNSIGYTNQEGTMKGTNYQRYTVQSKNDFHYGMFAAGVNVVLTYNQNHPLYSQVRGGMVGHVLQAIPTWSQFDATRAGGYGALYGDVVNLTHPLGMADESIMERTTENMKVFSNLYFSLEPIKGLKYRLNFTPDFAFYRNSTYQGVYDFGLESNTLSSLSNTDTRTRNTLVENLLTFDRTFGLHKLSLLAGYSYSDTRYRYLSGSGKGMPDGIKELSAATSGLSTSGNSYRSVLTSVLGRAFYSYDNRYLLTATIRRDGSSKFGSSKRYGTFPSVSVGWNIAEEKFVKSKTEWLNQLKLRGGYGKLGNQEIDNYLFASVVTTGINYPDGAGGVIQGAFPKEFANPDIKWEETEMTNIGLDFLALNSRLSFTADYYIKNTKDILLTVPIPISTGGANDPVRNAGKIRNNGFEFNIGWNDRVSNDLYYSVNFIGTFNHNEVVEMGSESQAITGGAIHGGSYTTKTLAGYPIGGFWLIPTDGIFQSEAEVKAHSKDGNLIQPSAQPGDIRFVDTDGNGIINDADRVYCGSPFPDFTYSINGSVGYKNFDLQLTFQGVTGNKIYNATRIQLENVTRGTNYLATTLDSWTPSNTGASNPRLVWTDPNQNARSNSDRFLEKGDYFRLRSLQIGYMLPIAWSKGVVKKARVYFNADNVFTITKYSGFSPDVNNNSAYTRGFDEFIYPANRTYMIGLNVTF